MAKEKRSFIRDTLLLWVVSTFGPFLIKALGSTWKMELEGEDKLDELRSKGEGILYAFWHSRILPLGYAYRNKGIKVMISQHSDGELIAKVVEQMGYHPIRGSSTKGGMKVAREFLRDDLEGDLAITPDGPRGPRNVAQSGTVYIASRGGYYLAPVGVDASSKWTLNSWDKFIIPKPFCRLKIIVGEPIKYPEDINRTEIEKYTSELTQRLNRIVTDAV